MSSRVEKTNSFQFERKLVLNLRIYGSLIELKILNLHTYIYTFIYILYIRFLFLYLLFCSIDIYHILKNIIEKPLTPFLI